MPNAYAAVRVVVAAVVVGMVWYCYSKAIKKGRKCPSRCAGGRGAPRDWNQSIALIGGEV